MRRIALPALVGALLLAADPARSQTMPIPESGNYVVQTGDTLESIALKFLGNSARWKDLLAANPGITNPHYITPGETIRIEVRDIKAKQATIQQVFRQVEQLPFPRPWTPAAVGEVLLPRDGVRTYEKSSSELRFDNESRLIVSEESVVFLREPATPAPAISRKAIEIRSGQADLDTLRNSKGVVSDIEFHIGDTTGTAKPGADGKGASRARRSADGGTRVMVYGGESDVTASGRTHAVNPGQGIAVTPDGRTNGPESLLPAPRANSPNESQNFDFSNPTFDWEPVSGAAGYTVEVCRDSECAQLVDRSVGVRMTRWTPRVLPIGTLYWRVSAISASGLDGFMSTPLKFNIRTYWRRPVESTGAAR